jgi:hypothetical protein
MVTKHKIYMLDLGTIEDYFEYILESRINGQHKQSLELYNDLAPSQKLDFKGYIIELVTIDVMNTGHGARELNDILKYYEG